MNLFSVLFVAALSFALCTTSADTIPSSLEPSYFGLAFAPNSSSGSSDTGLFGASNRHAPALVLDMFANNPAAQSPASLLGSLDGAESIGDWTLLLTDVDFGQEGAPVQWDLVVTAIPEPSTGCLLAIASLAALARTLRRRV